MHVEITCACPALCHYRGMVWCAWHGVVCMVCVPCMVSCAGKHAMVTAAVLPAAGEAVRRAGPLVGIPQLKHVPLAFLAPILGNIAGAIRGLIPIKSS